MALVKANQVPYGHIEMARLRISRVRSGTEGIAPLLQATTHGETLAVAHGSSRPCVTSSTSLGSSWRSCRSSHGSTTWWPPALSPGRKTHASVRRNRYHAWSPCWPKSFTSTDHFGEASSKMTTATATGRPAGLKGILTRMVQDRNSKAVSTFRDDPDVAGCWISFFFFFF